MMAGEIPLAHELSQSRASGGRIVGPLPESPDEPFAGDCGCHAGRSDQSVSLSEDAGFLLDGCLSAGLKSFGADLSAGLGCGSMRSDPESRLAPAGGLSEKPPMFSF